MEETNKEITEESLSSVLDNVLGNYQDQDMSQETFELMEAWRKSNPREFRKERRKAEHKLRKLEKKQRSKQ